MSNSENQLNSYAVLFGAQLAVGAAAIFARYALAGADPIMVSALRLAIAAIPLAIVALVKRKMLNSWRDEIALAIAGLYLGIHFATWLGSLNFISVAASTLLVSTSPVWTALYDVTFKRSAKPLSFWVFMILAAAGAYFVCTVDTKLSPLSGHEGTGVVLALVGAFAMAAYLIKVREKMASYGTLPVIARTYTWAAVILLVAAWLNNCPLPYGDLSVWGGIWGMALISQMLGHTGINYSLRHFSTSTVAVSTLLEPVFAAILASILFAETLTIKLLFGGVLVLISLCGIIRQDSGSSAKGEEALL
jgi:drug/metabolite transporter (DMT)-like permease